MTTPNADAIAALDRQVAMLQQLRNQPNAAHELIQRELMDLGTIREALTATTAPVDLTETISHLRDARRWTEEAMMHAAGITSDQFRALTKASTAITHAAHTISALGDRDDLMRSFLTGHWSPDTEGTEG